MPYYSAITSVYGMTDRAVTSLCTNWGDSRYIWIDYDLFPVAASYYTYVMSL